MTTSTLTNNTDPAVRNRVLSTLSRGLEQNRTASCLWIPYLHLFKSIKDARLVEVAELSQKAAKFCKDSVVLWMFYASLPVHDTFDKKINAYSQALNYMIKAAVLVQKKRQGDAALTKELEREQLSLSWGIFVLFVRLIQTFVDSGRLSAAKKKMKVKIERC